MFDNGLEIGPSAYTTLGAIKSCTDFKTGVAFPSIDVISQKSNISPRQTIIDLQTLTKHGYLIKTKIGRSNTYKLRDNIIIKDTDGNPVAKAIWPYVPAEAKAALDDIREVLKSGQFADAKVVVIEHLHISIINNESCSTVNIDANHHSAPVDKSGKRAG